MGWIRRQERAEHLCNVPYSSFGPQGEKGDLWLCDVCGIVWKVKMRKLPVISGRSTTRQKTWVVANFVTQILYGGLPREDIV